MKVDSLDLPLIRTKDGDGHPAKVFVGPPFFFKENGFPLFKGQSLIIWAVPMKVEGSDILVAFKIKDRDTGKKISLRDKKGEPVWWGGNNRQNKGSAPKRSE